MTMLKLIGSQWDGSRVDAPKREIPEHGIKLKLKGRNFRIKRLDDGQLVAYFMGELADDVLPNGFRRYQACDRCNYDQHTCPGCGIALSHDGIALEGKDRGYKHGTSCVE